MTTDTCFSSGRTREMINRGGEKIAPREVDEVLLEHPAVAEAVTFAVPTPRWARTSRRPSCCGRTLTATPKDIRQFAIGRIADFKVPRQVLIVEEIPKGPTGKVQRIGLAAKLGLATSRAASQDLRRATDAAREDAGRNLGRGPRTSNRSASMMISSRWAATRFWPRTFSPSIYDIMHLEVEVSRIFEAPTVAEMARPSRDVDPGRPGAASVLQPLCACPANGRLPASIAQERLWKLQQALPDLPFFNILYALRVTSPVDAAVLERSINEIVRRHEILRTTFAVVDGRHVQVIAPQLTVPLPFDDLQALPKSEKGSRRHTNSFKHELLHSFDLAHGPLFRARLVRLAEREHLLLITMHQIIVDGWSLGVFVDELAALYDAFCGRQGVAAWRRSPIQYADFAHWQRHWQSHPDIVAQLAYWREQLRDPLPAMQLATARPRRTIDDFRTARREMALPANLSEAAKHFSHREGGTLFMALVAALKTLLHRYSGSGRLASGHERRQSQSSGDRGTYRPARQYGHSPHQPRWRSQSSGGDAPGSRDDPRSLRPPGSSFRRARRDSRARARPQACGAGPGHDYCCRMPHCGRRRAPDTRSPSRRPIRAC